MNIKAQEQKVRLLNHLASQVEQIIEAISLLSEKYDPTILNDLHRIAAKVKSFTAKNQNSNLFRIFSKLEEVIFTMAKNEAIPAPHEIEHVVTVAQLAKEQIGIIYKSLILESNINNVIAQSSFHNDLNLEMSDISSKSGYLKITYGGQDISMFTEDQNSLLNKWYEELTPIGRSGKEISRRDAFLQSVANLIDEKNTTAEASDKLKKSVEELCGKFEMLQSVPLRPVVESIAERIKNLGLQLDKPIEVEIDIEDIQIPENLLEYVSNLISSVMELQAINCLESKEYRMSLGKPLPYKVKFKAVHNETHISFRISDDGNGKALFSRLNSIKNLKAEILKELLMENDISYQESNFTGRESIFTLTLPVSPWFFKAYLIESAGKEFLVPQAQVHSFLPLESDNIVDYAYLYEEEKLFYHDANGDAPSNVDGKIGILHISIDGSKQILICDSVSEPTYIRVSQKAKKDSKYLGTCKWADNKNISIFDVKKLTRNDDDKLVGIL